MRCHGRSPHHFERSKERARLARAAINATFYDYGFCDSPTTYDSGRPHRTQFRKKLECPKKQQQHILLYTREKVDAALETCFFVWVLGLF
jgi:hypothetical protein